MQIPDISDSTTTGTIEANYYYFEVRHAGTFSSTVLMKIPIFIEANKPNSKP